MSQRTRVANVTGHRTKASYSIAFKMKGVDFSKMLCPDGKAVRNTGAAKVLGADKKCIIEWSKLEVELDKGTKKSKRAEKIRKQKPGRKASTAEVEEELCEYINIQRKQHLGVGRHEVLNKLMKLKSDALGGLSKGDNPEEVENFDHRVNKCYSGFRKWHNFLIRYRTSVGESFWKASRGKRGRRG